MNTHPAGRGNRSGTGNTNAHGTLICTVSGQQCFLIFDSEGYSTCLSVLPSLCPFVHYHIFCRHMQGDCNIYQWVQVINPWRACAARVTVLGLSVCLSVHLLTTIFGLQATRRLMKDINIFRATSARKIKW